jgi:hypothetical protein
MPDFALDGGEEPEIAGLYVIGDDGQPYRVGYAIGNEFSDHVTERQNYLYLAHSKLRNCGVGPRCWSASCRRTSGTSRIYDVEGKVRWEKAFVSAASRICRTPSPTSSTTTSSTGCSSVPGDVHIHFFGTATLSVADNIAVKPAKPSRIDAPQFGPALRNTLTVVQNRNRESENIMIITGEALIGGRAVKGTGGAGSKAWNPSLREQPMEPEFHMVDIAQIDRACRAADAAFDTFRAPERRTRAFLETVAEQIMALGDELVERAMAESGLPRARIEGERGRTVGQLRLFANLLREGSWNDVRIDKALPERTPPRPDLRMRMIGVGPVAVFAASNFPLAFSVAGGDTASAFAAGCPVVLKAHSAHPGTSELVARAIVKAVELCGLPAGVFALLTGTGNGIGQALVRHPAIKAVGFTGSRSGGTALMAVAAARPQPIPVYAEMSSINPVFLMPRRWLRGRGHRQGIRRLAGAGRGPVLHQSRPGARVSPVPIWTLRATPPRKRWPVARRRHAVAGDRRQLPARRHAGPSTRTVTTLALRRRRRQGRSGAVPSPAARLPGAARAA